MSNIVCSHVDKSYGSINVISDFNLDVADRGPGIDPQHVDQIFEPFFTSGKGGTGLGLFIARELCQCNGALLFYEARPGGGSIFRIIFTDPQRWQARELRA